MSQSTKQTLAEYVAQNCPTEKEITIEHEGAELSVTVVRINLGELLSIEGLAGLLAKAGEEEDDFGVESLDVEDTAAQINVMDRVNTAGTTENEDTVRALPMGLKTKLFREVFAFQQLGGQTFQGAD